MEDKSTESKEKKILDSGEGNVTAFCKFLGEKKWGYAYASCSACVGHNGPNITLSHSLGHVAMHFVEPLQVAHRLGVLL